MKNCRVDGVLSGLEKRKGNVLLGRLRWTSAVKATAAAFLQRPTMTREIIDVH